MHSISRLLARVGSRDQTLTLLQLGFAFCFIGHGVFGLLQKPEWVVYFGLFGINERWAFRLMPVVGGVDILVGIMALIAPTRLLFVYGAAWTLFTAGLRPLAGQGVAEMLERAGNYGVPFALLLLAGSGAWLASIKWRPLAQSPTRLSVLTACKWTTALLLAGHALLVLQGKPLLRSHLALVGVQPELLPAVGVIELVAAIACVVAPSAALFIAVAAWKLASESLFLFTGAPVWEFVERAGSYAAPLTAAVLLAKAPATSLARAVPLRAAVVVVGMVAAALLPRGAAAQDHSHGHGTRPPQLTAALAKELQNGGFVVACRHAITSHEREDRSPVNFDDPGTQRVLSPAGEEQAIQLGKDLVGAGIPFGDILASPFQRTRRTAELMFARVAIDTALSSMGRGKDAELRALITNPVPERENRLLVTHQGVLYKVFTSVPHGTIGEGDCLVVKPKPDDFTVLALVKPAEWIQAGK